MRYEIYSEIHDQVRCSEDNTCWSIDDIVDHFCPNLEPDETKELVADCMAQLKDHCSLQHTMAIEEYGDRGECSSCVAVEKGYVADLLSLLPIEKLDRDLWPILRVAEREKAKREFIEENTPLWEAVGSVLKELREELGISITNVATAIGVSPSVIRNLEAGRPVQRAELVQKAYWWFIKCRRLLQKSSPAAQPSTEGCEEKFQSIDIHDEEADLYPALPWEVFSSN